LNKFAFLSVAADPFVVGKEQLKDAKGFGLIEKPLALK